MSIISVYQEFWRPLPRLSLRALNMCRRQWLVTQKLWKGALAFVILEPLISLVGMGLGIGQLMPSIGGGSYLQFIAIGLMIFSPANIAVIETMYGGFSRMQHQRTWEGIMDSSMSLDDVIFGELLWASFRGLVNVLSLLLVAVLLDAFPHPERALLIIPLAFVVAMAASAVGMVLMGLAKTYDIFTLFHTLVFAPATFLSGVFFPLSQLPSFIQSIAWCLPFAPLIESARQIMAGHAPSALPWALFLTVLYGVPAYYLGTVFLRKRLLG